MAKQRTRAKQPENENRAEVPETAEMPETPVTAEQEEASPEAPVVEQAQPEAAPEAVDPAAEALQAALAKQEEYLNMAQRVQADFDNYRRRNQNLRKESFDDGARSFAETLLPVLDNLERAIAAATESPDESLRSGVEMVYRQLTEAFVKRGITEVECLGKPFDPNLENAVMQGTPEEGEPGTVCAVFQKGYQMDGRLLRAAMVKVVPEA